MRHFSALAALFGAAVACPGAGHIWSDNPAEYPKINRAQAAGGVVTYTVDFAGFIFSSAQAYPWELINQLEGSAVRAFEKWNQVLDPIGLRFERRSLGHVVDIAVFALAYDVIIPPDVFGETVAGSLAFPLNGVMNFFPIVLNVDYGFQALDLRPTFVEGGLHHPYLRYVNLDGIDMYTTMLHEIGHQFGIGHPQEMFAKGRNFGFLFLDSVQVDGACMTPSDSVSGENLRRRGRFIATEIDSVMAPLQIGATATDLPPEDRAAAAYILREVNPSGADEMLKRAREIFEENYPLRFANVVYEHEFEPGVRANNDAATRAMPVEVGWIVLGSIAKPVGDGEAPDQDYYRFLVLPADVGREHVFDIDLGGGLSGSNWVDAVLELLDGDGTILARSDDVGDPDEGSISGLDPFLRWTPSEDGFFWVRVVAGPPPFEEGGIGDYELKIGVETVPVPAGSGAAFVDPTVSSCTFSPLEARPLTPVCGLLDLMSFCSGGLGIAGMSRMRRKRGEKVGARN